MARVFRLAASRICPSSGWLGTRSSMSVGVSPTPRILIGRESVIPLNASQDRRTVTRHWV